MKIKKLVGVMAFLGALLIAQNSSFTMQSAKNALDICKNVLIPSLFPFFVCSYMMINSGIAQKLGEIFSKIMMPLFKINGSGAIALVCGLISGYPMGAALSCKLYESGNVSKYEAERLVAFTNNSGPLFIIGAVGNGMFNSATLGYILYAAHIAAALTVGLVLGFFAKVNNAKSKPSNNNKPILYAFPEAVESTLNLCGYVIFFAVVIALLSKLKIIFLIKNALCSSGVHPKTANLISKGIFEITTALSESKGAYLPAVSGILSLGGASVLMQTLSMTKKAGLSCKYYICGKLLAGGISALYTCVLLKLVPIQIQTAANVGEIFEKSKMFAYYFSASTFLAISVFAVFSFIARVINSKK